MANDSGIPTKEEYLRQARLAFVAAPPDRQDDAFLSAEIKSHVESGRLPSSLLKILPREDGARVYCIDEVKHFRDMGASPLFDWPPQSLFKKFANDFHPHPESAQFAEIGQLEYFNFIRDENVPIDFMLIGDDSKDGSDKWFLGLAGLVDRDHQFAGINVFFGDSLGQLVRFVDQIREKAKGCTLKDEMETEWEKAIQA